MNAAKLKRLGLGVFVTLAVLSVFDLLPSFLPAPAIDYRILGHFYFWPAVSGAVGMFVAASAGAYVARANFVGSAIFLSITLWSFAIYFANSIATVVGQGDILAVAGTNVLGLLFGAFGAGLGAFVGGCFANRTAEAVEASV